jgi:4-diphosphocytidyl-2-C-methyl-D-erythritol kinase
LPDGALRGLGARLGSDVPFFLVEGGCVLMAGRGEALTPLPPLPERWLVLAKVEAGLSAGAVYSALRPDAWSDGSKTAAWLAEVERSRVLPASFNALESAAERLLPSVSEARTALREAGAEAVVMSGSGSTYFALCDTEAEALTVHGRLDPARWGGRSWVARFVTL